MSDLPAGFVLDQQRTTPNDLPAGFVLDSAPPQQASKSSYSGSILPLTRDAQGHVSFDSDAGILGAIKRAITLPGDVASGKTPIMGEDGHTNPEVINRSFELAATAGPMNPAIRAGDRAIPGAAKTLVPGKAKVPTTQELAAAGKADITAARNSGLEITAKSVADWSRKTQQKLFEDGIHPVDAPATYAKLKDLETAPPGSFATASNLQSLRESLGHTAQNFNPAAGKDQLAATRSIRGLDEFLPSLDQASVVAGTPAATQKLFETGRGNYAAAMRSNDITGALDRANTGILERAEVRAQAANSGRNLDNTIRQKVAAVLEKPKEVSGLSDAELSALNRVVEGGAVRNSARTIGNLFSGGGGAGQYLTGGVGGAAGFASFGVPGAIFGTLAPVAVGRGARTAANTLAKRDLEAVDELLRKRSPLYQQRVSAIPAEAQGLLLRELALRGSLGGVAGILGGINEPR